MSEANEKRNQNPAALNVFLVEDNEDDIELLKAAVDLSGVNVSIAGVAQDGDQALEYLRTRQPPLPDVVLLDLNLPRLSGLDLLKELQVADLPHIPVVVLSSSASRCDIENSYRYGASSYFMKHTNIDQFIAFVNAFYNYWMQALR